MSITHSESGQPDSVNNSGGAVVLTDQYTGNYQVEGAVDELRPIISRMTIAPKNWANAEEAAREIIQKVRPTSESEETRREVIGYIQRLIRNCLGIEVLPYGSVPLRTYLPDGDIDLTAFGGANVEEFLVDDMKFVLEREEKNRASEFAIKDVQLIRAEVKLVKCIVQNIVVDVSFNQIGGLSTLCFLEQIDRLIGRDHLFKNSIILIKAWCYYESRILGAHHGLISTYALETLVLYIFHLYHSTLDGPLSVLYKFLDYFSKFDWETYCISLNGPVRLSSLPDIVVEMPKDSDGNLLLSSDFLSSCVDMFSVPSRVVDQSSRGFQLKHLNIVDPLRETNNLGRSVSKGNFYRVRSAFTYGAKKLARILSQAENTIADELPKFFPNTMARHGSNQGPNIHDLDPSISCNGSISASHASDICVKGEDSEYENCDEVAHSTVLYKENPEPISPSHRCNGDANELATPGPESLTISSESSKSQNRGQTEMFKPVGKLYCAPHQFFAKSKSRKASSVKNGDQDSDIMETMHESPEKDEPVEKEESAGPSSSSLSNHAQVSSTCSTVPESLNLLTDLTGDYDSYFQCLQYGRWCYEYTSGLHHIPTSPNAIYHNAQWDGARPPPFKRNGFAHQHRNGFHQNPAVYAAMPHMVMPGAAFGWEDIPKPRGTGTYFPNMNQMPQGYRSSSIPAGIHKVSSRPPFNNGHNMIYQMSSMENGGQEPPQSQIPASFDDYRTVSPLENECPDTSDGLVVQPEAVVEFGSVGPTSGISLSETSKHQKPVNSSPRTLRQKSPPAFSEEEQDRISPRSSYHLKDQDDFPPL